MHPANSHNKRDTAKPVQANGLNAETLFADYRERIYRFSLCLCGGNTTDAEDLAQDVLLSALRARESFQGHSAVLIYREAARIREIPQGDSAVPCS